MLSSPSLLAVAGFGTSGAASAVNTVAPCHIVFSTKRTRPTTQYREAMSSVYLLAARLSRGVAKNTRATAPTRGGVLLWRLGPGGERFRAQAPPEPPRTPPPPRLNPCAKRRG